MKYITENKIVQLLEVLEGTIVSAQGNCYEVVRLTEHENVIALLLKSELPPDMPTSFCANFDEENDEKLDEKIRKNKKSYIKAIREPASELGNSLGAITLLGTQCAYGTFHNAKRKNRKVLWELYLGFDAEWQEYGDNRRILTEQWSFRDTNGVMYVWVLFHLSDKRQTLKNTLSWLLEDNKDLMGIERLPKKFRLCITLFNGLADISIFKDRKKIYSRVDSIRNKLVSLEKPMRLKFYDESRNVVSTALTTLRDCALLAPNNVNLAALGDAMQVPKIDIPVEQKSRMNDLLLNDIETYVCYAAQDAVITLLWIEYIRKVMGEVPVTIGSEGARRIKEGIMRKLGLKSNNDFDKYWRGICVEIKEINEKGKPVAIKTPLPNVATLLHVAANCYYGGRNECFYFGFSPGIFYDYDIASAYPNAMCLLEDPDFEANTELINDVTKIDFDYNDYLFARVHFEFPPDTKFPCLPIRDRLGRGLIYPLSGDTWASAPELKVALWLGAKIITYEAYRQPKKKGIRTLASVETELVRQRLEAKKRYGKGSVYEILLKEIANSGYGKMGQGLAGKRSFSSRKANMIDIGPSPITSAPAASMITSMVRAAVSEAMCKLHKWNFRIASVTTDGFLNNAPAEVMKAACNEGILKYFADNLYVMVGAEEVFELKHACEGLFCMKTRGQLGFKPYKGKEVPIAKAGYKPPKDKKEDIEYLAKQFLERDKNGLLNEFVQLPSMRECVLKDKDYVGKQVRKRTYWDFDYKRLPDKDTAMEFEIEIAGVKYKHVFYDTKPWPSFKDFLENAEKVRRRREPVKTKKDVDNAVKLIKHLSAIHEEGRRVCESLERTYATSILRGIRQGVLVAPWLKGKTGKEICKRVGEVCGVELTGNDWKHAGRKDRKEISLAGAESYLEELGLLWRLELPSTEKERSKELESDNKC